MFALLVCPALVYFFFVFYGGQAAAVPTVRRYEIPSSMHEEHGQAAAAV